MQTMKRTMLATAIMALSMGAQAAVVVDLQLNALELNRSGLDWYVPDGSGNAENVGSGNVVYNNPSSEMGFALGVTFDLGNNWVGTFRYSGIEFKETDRVSDPSYSLGATRVHADDWEIGTGDWDEGMNRYKLDKSVIDLELGYNVAFGDGKGKIRPLFGLRSASIDQSMYTFYNDSAFASDDAEVDEKLEAKMLGLYVGAEVGWQLNELIGFEGRFDTGVLNSKTKRKHIELASQGQDLVVDTGSVYNESVTLTNVKVGVVFKALQRDNANLDVGVGLQYTDVTGMSDFMDFPDDVVDSKLSRNLQSLGFSGAYLNLRASF